VLTIRGNVNSGSFGAWDGACRGRASICRLVIDGSQKVRASFSGAIPLDTFPGLNVVVSGTGNVKSKPGRINCGGSDGECSAAFEPGEKVELQASAQSPWEFDGWGSACPSKTATVSGKVCSVEVHGQTTVSAKFGRIRDELRITRSGDGKGTVTSEPPGITCGTACSNAFVDGQTVKLHAERAKGSTFGGWSWSGCSVGADCRVTMSQKTVIVTARFDLVRHPVQVRKTGDGGGTVTSAPPGIACGPTCSAPFPGGSRVTLRATPDASSRFAGWSTCSGRGECSFTVTAAKTVTARFERLRDGVTVEKLGKGKGLISSSPAGISCGDRCTAPFARGTRVVLTATPRGGSKFAGWSGSCSGTGSCTVTVDGPTVVGARFARICAVGATSGFRAAVARGPRRIIVHLRVAGPVTARLRLFRGQRRVAQKVISLAAGERRLRLDVPRGAARGTYRIGVRIADACGGSKLFSKKLSVPG
jgi:hypothetical protein